ncbi:MAG: hypothetical protein FWG61_04615 [Firmicutes bacterium]|nr:hypothetical protein [Bacillota bacterium]
MPHNANRLIAAIANKIKKGAVYFPWRTSEGITEKKSLKDHFKVAGIVCGIIIAVFWITFLALPDVLQADFSSVEDDSLSADDAEDGFFDGGQLNDDTTEEDGWEDGEEEKGDDDEIVEDTEGEGLEEEELDDDTENDEDIDHEELDDDKEQEEGNEDEELVDEDKDEEDQENDGEIDEDAEEEDGIGEEEAAEEELEEELLLILEEEMEEADEYTIDLSELGENKVVDFPLVKTCYTITGKSIADGAEYTPSFTYYNSMFPSGTFIPRYTLTFTNSDPDNIYTFIQSGLKNGAKTNTNAIGEIIVNSGVNVTLKIDSIDMNPGYFNSNIRVLGSGSLTLQLEGESYIRQNIWVPDGAELIIENAEGSSGSLIMPTTTSAVNYARIGGSQAEKAGSITINSGTLDIGCRIGSFGAGIGGGGSATAAGDGGVTTIKGGTIDIQMSSYGAGIGGGGVSTGTSIGGNGGTINIKGGVINITQNGYDGTGSALGGAAIGGGCNTNTNPGYMGGNGGNITISNGKVTIIQYSQAAGIGAGSRGSVGDICIEGGDIDVQVIRKKEETGAGEGAGIGGSSGTNSEGPSSIKISGGKISAIATASSADSHGAAGIGTSNGTRRCDIEITGGTIYAKSIESPGIGYFDFSNGSIMKITGGTVVAESDKNAGIGAPVGFEPEFYLGPDADVTAYSGGNMPAFSVKDNKDRGYYVNASFDGPISTTEDTQLRVFGNNKSMVDKTLLLPKGYKNFGYSTQLIRSSIDNIFAYTAYGINAVVQKEYDDPQIPSIKANTGYNDYNNILLVNRGYLAVKLSTLIYYEITEHYVDAYGISLGIANGSSMVLSKLPLFPTYEKNIPADIPPLPGYVGLGYKWDTKPDGNGADFSTTKISQEITKNSDIYYVYGAGYTITEIYVDTHGDIIGMRDTFTSVPLNGAYTKVLPPVAGYVALGHKWDAPPVNHVYTEGGPTRDPVTGNATVYFVYAPYLDLSETIADGQGYTVSGGMDPYSIQYPLATNLTGGGAVSTDSGGFRKLTFSGAVSSEPYTIVQSGKLQSPASPNEPKHQTAIFDEIIITTGTKVTLLIDDIDLIGNITLQGTAQVELLIANTGAYAACAANYLHGSLNVPSEATLTIDEAPGGPGSLQVNATNANAAAIGGLNGESAGKITVKGGEISALADVNGYMGAGIGGGNNGCSGQIIIAGGKVNCQAYNGAGIGCGASSLAGTNIEGSITISQSTVSATSAKGAGIGGGVASGDFNSFGTITINGFLVTATCLSGDSAAIGAGYTAGTAALGGSIIMDGGVVEAISNGGGAAIGGAKGDTGSTSVTISGGKITAKGNWGAGIGGGWQGMGALINIGAAAQIWAYSRDQETEEGQPHKPAIDAVNDNAGDGYYINAMFNKVISPAPVTLKAYADNTLSPELNTLVLPANYRCFAYSTGLTAMRVDNIQAIDSSMRSMGDVVRVVDNDPQIYSIKTLGGYNTHNYAAANGVLPVKFFETTLTVGKSVSGTFSECNKVFVFSIYLVDYKGDAEAIGTTFAYTGDKTDTIALKPDDGTLTLSEDGMATFYLKHGQTITIAGIPAKNSMRIVETIAPDYVASFTDDQGPAGTNDTGVRLMSKLPRTIAFTNARNEMPITGLSLGNIKASLLLPALTLFLGLLALMVRIAYRRRKGGEAA